MLKDFEVTTLSLTSHPGGLLAPDSPVTVREVLGRAGVCVGVRGWSDEESGDTKGKYFFVSLEEIKENDYDLSISKCKDIWNNIKNLREMLKKAIEKQITNMATEVME